MALRPFNSIAGISVGNTSVDVILANGDITTTNITANGIVNFNSTSNVTLGTISNIHIAGGNSGQVLTTDGAGNLTFADTASSDSAAPMPYIIPVGESYFVPENFQGLFTVPITIDGTFEIDGILAEVGTAINSLNSQIIFDDNGELTGNAGFTFDQASGNFAVPGNATVASIATNNYYYANGQPLDFGGSPGGSNTQIQFNNAGEFGATANLSFDSATNNLAISGNIVLTTGAYYGNGSGLTNIAGANVTGTVANATTAGTVTTNAQPNITSVGTLTGLVVSGSITPSANISYDLGNATNAFRELYLSGNTIRLGSSNISSNGTGITLANPSGGTFTVVGTQAANSASIINGTSNIIIQPNANINFSVAGNSNVVAMTGSGASINGTLNVSGNGVIGGNLFVNGNLVYINVEELAVRDPIITLNSGANGAFPVANTGKDVGTALYYYDTQAQTAFMGWDTSNSEFSFGSQTTISNEVVAFNTLGNARAQTFKGNVDSANSVSANYLISTSGCVTISGATIAVSGNNAGIFASLVDDINLGLVSNIVMGGVTETVTVQGNLIANVNVTATGTVSGNLLTGTITTNAQPNITSVGTLGNLSVTGNVSSANLTVTNTIDAVNIKVTDLYSKRPAISVTANTMIDSFPTTQFRSAKYTMRAGDGTDYQALEVLLVHDNINSIITVYGSLSTSGSDLVLFSTDISSGNVNVYATAIAPNTNLNLMGTYVPD
jgi:hypothetical protein